MTNVASTAAQLSAISHAGEDSVFFWIPSHLEGFVQAGEPKESVRTKEFGTSTKRCRKAVQILTVPGRPAVSDAPCCPCCGKAMEKNGKAPLRFGTSPGDREGEDRGLAAKMGMQGNAGAPSRKRCPSGPQASASRCCCSHSCVTCLPWVRPLRQCPS
jgi:hypothetical protein